MRPKRGCDLWVQQIWGLFNITLYVKTQTIISLEKWWTVVLYTLFEWCLYFFSWFQNKYSLMTIIWYKLLSFQTAYYNIQNCKKNSIVFIKKMFKNFVAWKMVYVSYNKYCLEQTFWCPPGCLTCKMRICEIWQRVIRKYLRLFSPYFEIFVFTPILGVKPNTNEETIEFYKTANTNFKDNYTINCSPKIP